LSGVAVFLGKGYEPDSAHVLVALGIEAITEAAQDGHLGGIGIPAPNGYIMGHRSMTAETFFKFTEALGVAPHILWQRAEARISEEAASRPPDVSSGRV